MTLHDLIASDTIRATITATNDNPYMDGDAPMYHYRVTLRRHGRQMTVPFSTGTGWTTEPTAEDVLACLISDSWGAEQTFEEWCMELGYDDDSRRAERTYRAVTRQTEKLRRFLGDAFTEYQEAEQS